MPIVALTDLPAYKTLSQQGHEVLAKGYALKQDIRELHIGLLNMMPDAALKATERQFLKMINSASGIVQIYVHLFNIPGIERGEKASKHIEQYYEPFEKIQNDGLDALILTGTNIAKSDITDEPFWPEFTKVIDWARDHVPSILCSCLATHAVVRYLYNIKRTPFEQKLWGVYEHVKADKTHPLMQGMNTRFFAPHSRNNDISREAFETAGARIIVESEKAGVHMATSADGFRFIFLQGHPEYDVNSLLKEYKREVQNYLDKTREDYPPFPENYLNLQCQAILREYQNYLKEDPNKPFPEDIIEERLENIWIDSSKSFMNNWVGKVYQTTNMDRTKLFMDGIDQNDPLGILKHQKAA